MENLVLLTCILSHRDDDSFYVNSSNECFVRCIGFDTSEIPLKSYLHIIGHLANTIARNITYTVVYVDSLAIIP